MVQLFIRFLYRLASLNKDYAVVMCRLGTKEALVKALDKHSTNLLLVTELRDLITDCEKYASLYKKMTTSVLAGCIQVTGDTSAQTVNPSYTRRTQTDVCHRVLGTTLKQGQRASHAVKGFRLRTEGDRMGQRGLSCLASFIPSLVAAFSSSVFLFLLFSSVSCRRWRWKSGCTFPPSCD